MVEVKEIFSFNDAKYVFTGKIASKVYAKDSLTYVVTFNIYKHYKKAKSYPQNIKMKFESESKYTHIESCCGDFSCKVGDEWLIFADKPNSKSPFYRMGVNSQSIENGKISEKLEKIFEKVKTFNINDYIFESGDSFNYCRNVTDIKNILRSAKVKCYPKDATVLSCLINKNGKLKLVKVKKGIVVVRDTIFDLITRIEDKKGYPISEFEKDAIKLLKKVKRWEIKKDSKTGKGVCYIKDIFIYCDFESKKWGYWF